MDKNNEEYIAKLEEIAGLVRRLCWSGKFLDQQFTIVLLSDSLTELDTIKRGLANES